MELQGFLYPLIHCHICVNKNYASVYNLKKHLSDNHNIIIHHNKLQNGQNRPTNENMVILNKGDNRINLATTCYACPGCWHLSIDLQELAGHIEEDHTLKDTTTHEDIKLTHQAPIKPLQVNDSNQDETDTILPMEYALNKTLQTNKEHVATKMIRNILVSANLNPFNIYLDGKETIAYTTDKQINRLLEYDQNNVKRIRFTSPYQESSLVDNNCRHVMQTSASSYLNHIISHCLYRNVLGFDTFAEINSEQLLLLNSPWKGRPYMNMACAQLLAGCILVDDGKALLVNCVEVYSGFKTLDAHYERFSPDSPTATSLPKLGTRYSQKIRFTKMKDDNSLKLVIGTTTFNALVTSSIRIDDCDIAPEVGPSTYKFEVSDKTSLYLSNSSILKSNQILANKSTSLAQNSDPAAHIRQLRSNFSMKSTYTFSRFHSMFINALTCQPPTIYTHADSYSKADTDDKAGSRIFQHVIESLYTEDDKAGTDKTKQDLVLLKSKIENELVGKRKVKTQMDRDFAAILKLFGDKNELNVIENTELETILSSIASTVTTNGLKRRRSDVVSFIWEIFKENK